MAWNYSQMDTISVYNLFKSSSGIVKKLKLSSFGNLLVNTNVAINVTHETVQQNKKIRQNDKLNKHLANI